MTKQEYDKQRKEILNSNLQRLRDLDKSFCDSQNPHKVGDMITDHIGTIKIDSIGMSFPYGSGYPACVYYGPRYTKKGVPFKDGSEASIYQENIKP